MIGYCEGTEYHNIYSKYCQKSYEVHEVFIIPFPYAGTEPYAMMIKMHDTVIAQVAMSSPLWSEYHTSLTELKPVQLCFLIEVKVKDSLRLSHDGEVLRVERFTRGVVVVL